MTRNDTRKVLLETVHDLLSSYLVDECPEDENWEDFDPEIDTLRGEIGDILDAERTHLATAPTEPSRFTIEIQFFSDRERFATETYDVDAIDWVAAKCAAFTLADASPYSDDRIPDLNRQAFDRTGGNPA